MFMRRVEEALLNAPSGACARRGFDFHQHSWERIALHDICALAWVVQYFIAIRRGLQRTKSLVVEVYKACALKRHVALLVVDFVSLRCAVIAAQVQYSNLFRPASCAFHLERTSVIKPSGGWEANLRLADHPSSAQFIINLMRHAGTRTR